MQELDALRHMISGMTNPALDQILDETQAQIDELLEAEERGAGQQKDYPALCLLRRELTAESKRRETHAGTLTSYCKHCGEEITRNDAGEWHHEGDLAYCPDNNEEVGDRIQRAEPIEIGDYTHTDGEIDCPTCDAILENEPNWFAHLAEHAIAGDKPRPYDEQYPIEESV